MGIKMILKVTETNNGYGCQCCAQGGRYNDWIKEEELMTGEQLLAFIDNQRSNMSNDHIVSISYEKDGIRLYGFDSDVYRIGEDSYITIEHDKFLYKTSIDSRKDGEVNKIKLIEFIDEARGKICH